MSAWSNPASSGGRYFAFSIDRRFQSKDGLRNTKKPPAQRPPARGGAHAEGVSELALGAREAEPPMVGGSRGRPDRTEDVNETAAIDNDSPVFEG